MGTTHELHRRLRHAKLGSKQWITAYCGYDAPLHRFPWRRWRLIVSGFPCVLVGRMCECLGYRVQALQCQGFRFAKVERGELAVLRAVGFPVPSTTLVARA